MGLREFDAKEDLYTLEVLYLTDPVDEYVARWLKEFDTKEDWTRHCDAAHAGNRARYVRYATLVKNLPSRLNSKEIFSDIYA